MTFDACEICGASGWTEVYRGRIRDGVFGSNRDDGVIARCGGCGVERLAEQSCLPDSYYQSDAYRAKLLETEDSTAFFETYDELQIHTLDALWPLALRGKTIADVGCAGGSLLDHLRGVSGTQVAIEPNDMYRRHLSARGYSAYPYASDAARDFGNAVDCAFSIQVIEHSANPRAFLEEIRPLLKPDGRLVISTPNRRDILFRLLPDEYPSFFYRVVHRWYFDATSLAACAQLAGFHVTDVRHVHRYGMANALRWMRDRRPTGNATLDGIDASADSWWASYTEANGLSDCLYLVLEPS